MAEENQTPPAEQTPPTDVSVELNLGAGPEATPPEPKAEVPPQDEGPVEYVATGDVGLDMALGFIGKLGIGPAHPAIQAAKTGDFSFIKAHLAGLGPKSVGWEQYVALAEKSFDNAKSQATAAAQQTRTVVEQAVGGAENWGAIQQWAKANADEGERTQINAMLSAGGLQAQAAAQYLARMYEQAHDTIKEPADAAKPTAGRPAGATNGPLSPQEYNKELKALISKIGASRVGDSQEYQQLQQRRRAFRG